MATAFSQAQLDALEAAIASGVLTVRHGNELVQYRTLDEMLRARDVMRAALSAVKRPMTHVAGFSRG